MSNFPTLRSLLFGTILLTILTSPLIAQKQEESSSVAAGPQLKAVNAYVFGGLVCTDEDIDTIMVYNEGDATLNITPSLGGLNFADFSILPPHNAPYTIRARDSIAMRVRFTTATYGTRTAQIRLANNDPRPDRNPWTIDLTAARLRSDATISATELDFGEICVNSTKELSLTINYVGDIDDKLNGVPKFLGANGVHFTILQPNVNSLGLKQPSDRKTILVQFNPQSAGTFVDSARISVGQCVIPFTFVVRGSAIDMRPRLYNTPDSIDFGQRAVGAPGVGVSVKIQNFGTSKIAVQSMFITPPTVASEFQLPNSMIGKVISPAGIEGGTLTFKPTRTGLTENAQFCMVLAQGGCVDTLCIKIRGEGVAPVLGLTRTQLNFAADSCAEIATVIYDTVYLHNRGTLPANVRTVESNNSPKVGVRLNPPLTTRLNQGDSVGIIVEVRPGQPGPNTAKILIATDDPDPDRDTLVIDIFMKLESTVIKLLFEDGTNVPAAIDFGTGFGCEPKRDTFMLRNAGTLDAVVKGGFAQGTAFSLVPGPPYALKGNLDTAILVVFDPPAAGEYRDTLTLQNGTCSDQVIRVAVAGRRYDLTFDPQGINFGQSNIGAARSGTASLTNTSQTPADVKVRVIDAFISPATATGYSLPPLTQFPVDIGPNDMLTTIVLFQPTQEIAYDAQLCYVTQSPCLDTICVPLTGQGIQSDIFIERNELNFGTRYTCDDDSTLTLSIRNIGTKPLELRGLAILPSPGSTAFSQVTTIDLPTPIAPGDSEVVAYRFTPSLAPADGPVSAMLEVSSDDIKQATIHVPLIGRRRSYALSSTGPIDFGRVTLTLSKDTTITLYNSSPDSIRIFNLDLPLPFSVVGTAPMAIAPFDSASITLRFAPSDTLKRDTALGVVYGGKCDDTLSISLSGEGRPPLTGFAEIAIPTTVSGKPGERITIPLVLKRSNLIAEVGATTFQAVIRFNNSMLEPIGARGKYDPLAKGAAGAQITTGEITSKMTSGNDLIVTVRITNSPMPTVPPDTLGYLDANVLLGNAVTTPIAIDSVRWLDGNMNTEMSQGLFSLSGYCDIGGNRILRVSGNFGIRSIAPNPFNPSTEIIFETAEAGSTSLVIHDVYGRRVATLIDGESLPVQAHSRVWDASAFPSGIYYAELVTPTQRSLYRLLLLK